MFVILLSYKQDLQQIDRFVAEHRAFLQRYYASGHFLLSGRKEPRTGGVILAKGRNREEIQRIVHEDPFHREDLAAYEIIEFSPTMSAPEWSAFLLPT